MIHPEFKAVALQLESPDCGFLSRWLWERLLVPYKSPCLGFLAYEMRAILHQCLPTIVRAWGIAEAAPKIYIKGWVWFLTSLFLKLPNLIKTESPQKPTVMVKAGIGDVWPVPRNVPRLRRSRCSQICRTPAAKDWVQMMRTRRTY